MVWGWTWLERKVKEMKNWKSSLTWFQLSEHCVFWLVLRITYTRVLLPIKYASIIWCWVIQYVILNGCLIKQIIEKHIIKYSVIEYWSLLHLFFYLFLLALIETANGCEDTDMSLHVQLDRRGVTSIVLNFVRRIKKSELIVLWRRKKNV